MILERHFEQLRERWPGATMSANADGSHVVTVPRLPLPPGWSRTEVDVAFVVPVGYPVSSPDCFWTERELTLSHGGVPQNTGYNAGAGVPDGWLWFSWHPAHWNGNTSNLDTYVQVIRGRFRDVR